MVCNSKSVKSSWVTSVWVSKSSTLRPTTVQWTRAVSCTKMAAKWRCCRLCLKTSILLIDIYVFLCPCLCLSQSRLLITSQGEMFPDFKALTEAALVSPGTEWKQLFELHFAKNERPLSVHAAQEKSLNSGKLKYRKKNNSMSIIYPFFSLLPNK